MHSPSNSPGPLITNSDYFGRIRTDVLAAIPSGAKNVLSVGCGSGATEEILTKRGINVVGIEINEEAAAEAKRRGITILAGDATEAALERLGIQFDFMVYADVLEHLPNPELVLARHIESLRPGGGVYISVPNFRHYSVLWQLAFRGEIRYVDAGILDRTHLRITTRKMVIRWLADLGLPPAKIRYGIHGRRFRVLSWLTGGLLDEFVATQVYLLGFRPETEEAASLNQVEL